MACVEVQPKGANYLECKKCGYVSRCHGEWNNCSDKVEPLYKHKGDRKTVLCTTPENDNEDIKTVCGNLADKDLADGGALEESDTYSSSSEFINIYPNMEDLSIAEKCAVCVYDWAPESNN